MEFLRNSPFRRSLTGSRRRSESMTSEVDYHAWYTSFQKHWYQVLEIMERTQSAGVPLRNDDILAVVSLLEKMLSFLFLELKSEGTTGNLQSCVDYLLSENLLDKVLTWSLQSGEFTNRLKLHQLKMYETLLSNSKRELLVHEAVLRPLLKLLAACSDCCPVDVEKRLVVLLNQLCVMLIQDDNLLNLFFYGETNSNPASFIIFTLLVRFVHREGAIGQQALDALLLCMKLSKKNDTIGIYISEHPNFCPVLATGLSALYSALPRKLSVDTEGWHCFTIEDANDVPEIANFLNSLEFCNAVVQMAHASISSKLLEYIYQGFLIPVMAPALYQDTVGLSLESFNSAMESNIVDETIASTAYFNLFLRTISEPALLRVFLKFLLCVKQDDQLIVDVLIRRIESNTRLCLVTLSLFRTILDLNCEDVMLELVFRYLIPCSHVMVSQRCKMKELDVTCRSAQKFLSMTPTCCLQTPAENIVTAMTRSPTFPASRRGSTTSEQLPEHSSNKQVLLGSYIDYLHEARLRIKHCTLACSDWVYVYDGDRPASCHPKAPSSTAGNSSGYNSFPFREPTPDLCSDDNGKEWDDSSMVSDHAVDSMVGNGDDVSLTASVDASNSVPNIGPFLNAIFQKLENMTSHNLYVNLQLTAVITRLAIYPQPLLRSFLLNGSLVFQPSVRSLFQILGTLKQRIDQYTSQLHRVEELVQEARWFLLARDETLMSGRMQMQHPASPGELMSLDVPGRWGSNRTKPTIDVPPKVPDTTLRSISSAIFNTFKRYNDSFERGIRESLMETVPETPSGYRFTKQLSSVEQGREADQFLITRHLIFCAVLLEEWLKELAATAQEHGVVHQDLGVQW